jgi:hypothetical protein
MAAVEWVDTGRQHLPYIDVGVTGGGSRLHPSFPSVRSVSGSKYAVHIKAALSALSLAPSKQPI